jgi:hypothetical protein
VIQNRNQAILITENQFSERGCFTLLDSEHQPDVWVRGGIASGGGVADCQGEPCGWC